MPIREFDRLEAKVDRIQFTIISGRSCHIRGGYSVQLAGIAGARR